MKHYALLFMVSMFSTQIYANECRLNDTWDVLHSEIRSPSGSISTNDQIQIQHSFSASGGNHFDVYILRTAGPEFLCRAQQLTDVQNTEWAEFTQGSFPRISCTYHQAEEMMQFTAALVKDGESSVSHCANDFFVYDRENPVFGDAADAMVDSCYSEYSCAIYWQIKSLDHNTNEGDGQGTGGSNGTDTPPM
ncbi:MAG: hypothetical protein MI750_00910 [Xanthomonadales bacterium]|jgi:hypothetical protein|nr:hypothetical protein [Xanthomonadales bacterium]